MAVTAQWMLDFIKRADAVQALYLRKIGRHIREIGQMLPSDVDRIVEMRKASANLLEIQQALARFSGKSVRDIQAMFSAAAAMTYLHGADLLTNGGPPSITDIDSTRRIVEAQARITSGAMVNLSQTTIQNNTYIKAVDLAVTTAQMGVDDYTSVMRTVMRQVASQGMRVRYASGLTRRLDSAVRQNVLDGLHALDQAVLDQVGEDFGADGIELSAHNLCAPDHLPYQGRQYSIAQFQSIQSSLKRPFGMWNCRHLWYPIVMGVSRPTYTDAQLRGMQDSSSEQIAIGGVTKTRYGWTQEQRKLETKLRQAEDEVVLAKALGDQQMLRGATATRDALINTYDGLSDAAGLLRKYERIYR